MYEVTSSEPKSSEYLWHLTWDVESNEFELQN